MKPKILIGLTYYLPNISGVTQYAVILAEELVKRNYEVEILTAKYKKELKNESNIKRVGGFSVGKGFVMPMYWRESFTAVQRVAVINCHLPSVESFWLAGWGKIFGKKIIVTHHCEFAFNGTWSNKIVALLSFLGHYLTYLMADTIVAYTKDYADNSMFLKIFNKKITYILPPIKLENNRKKFYHGKEKIVGFVGRIGWEKGLDLLIKSMNNIEAKLILVGPYREVVGDKTYEKLKKIINSKVVFYGPINHGDIRSFYERCDCLVLPSTNNLETFGIVQAEAMVCGCPVVASDLPGVRVPVQMTKMGEICEVNNVADLTEKIKLVLKNGKKYYQDRSVNLDKFDYRKTVDEYEKIFVPRL